MKFTEVYPYNQELLSKTNEETHKHYEETKLKLQKLIESKNISLEDKFNSTLELWNELEMIQAHKDNINWCLIEVSR